MLKFDTAYTEFCFLRQSHFFNLFRPLLLEPMNNSSTFESSGWEIRCSRSSLDALLSHRPTSKPATGSSLSPAPVPVFPRLTNHTGSRGVFNALASLPDRTEMLAAPVPRLPRSLGTPALKVFLSERLPEPVPQLIPSFQVPEFISFR